METEQRSGIARINHTKNIVAIIGVIMILGLGVSAYIYSIDNSALTYYGDSVSHLAAARKLFDWAENPGWSQIGTVWLPLPHAMLMLPSLVDALFFSGFAGVAVSLPSLAGTSILLYKIVVRLLDAGTPTINKRIIPYAAFAVALLYATNPNFLYLGITAMTEAPFMLFFVASAYFLLRWNEEMRRPEQQRQKNGTSFALKYLLASSAFAAAATLCRYEGWMLPLFLVLCAPARQVIEVLANKRRRSAIKSSERRDDGLAALQEKQHNAKPRIIVYTILVSSVSLSGVIFWVVYNAASYGDPLAFEHAQSTLQHHKRKAAHLEKVSFCSPIT